MKRTNSESNRDQRPLLAGLQPLSSIITAKSPAALSKRNRKHTADNLARPVGFRDGQAIADDDSDGDVILDDDDDEVGEEGNSSPSSGPQFIFNPVRTPSDTIFVEGLSNPPPFLKGSIRHPVPIDRDSSSTRPIFEVKHLSIKNLKYCGEPQNSTGPPNAEQLNRKTASILLRAIQCITSEPSGFNSVCLNKLSYACEGLVLHSPTICETLYEQVHKVLERKAISIRSDLMLDLPLLGHTSLDFSRSLPMLNDARCLDWLNRLRVIWQEWLDRLLLIRSILIYLDRTILVRSNGTLPIWELGLNLFRKHVLGSPLSRFSLSLSSVVCKQTNLDRSGNCTSIGLIQSILELLHTTVGPSGFEEIVLQPLVHSTNVFYNEESHQLICQIDSDTLPVGGAGGYLHHSLSRIDSETERLDKLFTTSDRALNIRTKSLIVHHVQSNLILHHLDTLLHKGFGHLLESFPDLEPSQSLRDLYRLLHDLGKEPSQRLRAEFLSWMKEVGSSIVGVDSETIEEREKKDDEMVQKLISFKIKMDEVVKICFDSEREMAHAIKEAFENFLNRRHNKPAELIAKYLDRKLRHGNKSMTDAEMDQCLNQILILFRYTQGKDIFEEFYKRDLSRRLLLSKSASIDSERNMVMKLKEECGPGFTAKIESMFRDIETSADINTAYITNLKKSPLPPSSNPLDLSVFVLTAGSWPTSHTPESNVVLPPYLESHLARFEKFYQSKHLGRRLRWSHSLGQWVVSANFPGNGKGRKKELSVSTYQGLVLLLFNEVGVDDSITFNTILQRTSLGTREAARTLQSLACGKFRVLVKTPKGKEVSEMDQFSLNPDFKHENFKIKINQIQLKETATECKSTTDKVIIERGTLLQLSIVRIMKSRKKIKHAELVLEAISQLSQRFQVEPKEVKIAIENLIGRDYMERVEGTKDEYHYLA